MEEFEESLVSRATLRSNSSILVLRCNRTLASGETIALWSSQDALVIKILTWNIQQILEPALSKTCYNLKGHGGLKAAVREVLRNYPHYRFFCKTDVKSYYDSIDHLTIMLKLHDHISDRILMGYVWQFLNRCVEWGGLYQDIKRGIPRGASLSPLLGAFYLLDLDRRMERLDVKYFRFMDDILILAPTRWKLKKAIGVLNATFTEIKLEKHPDKTAMGRIEKGFGVSLWPQRAIFGTEDHRQLCRKSSSASWARAAPSKDEAARRVQP